MINAIVIGLDDYLKYYQTNFCNIYNMIDKLLTQTKELMTNEVLASLYLFKSKLEYYDNEYEKAIDYAEKGLTELNGSNLQIKFKLSLHLATIQIELGNSRECVDILSKEFKNQKEIGNEKNIITVAIKLCRVLNHCGQINEPLEIYKYIEDNFMIKDDSIISTISEQKANVLNKIMFKKLDYGFIKKTEITDNDSTIIKQLFDEAIELYTLSLSIISKNNNLFSYTGVVPEKINTYVAYSQTYGETCIDECEALINQTNKIVEVIDSPFVTDYNISKACYYEFKANYDEADSCFRIALDNSQKLKNKNKEAKCHMYYCRFIYRRVKNNDIKFKNNHTLISSIHRVKQAIDYYQTYTLETSLNLINCKTMLVYFTSILEQI